MLCAQSTRRASDGGSFLSENRDDGSVATPLRRRRGGVAPGVGTNLHFAANSEIHEREAHGIIDYQGAARLNVRCTRSTIAP